MQSLLVRSHFHLSEGTGPKRDVLSFPNMTLVQCLRFAKWGANLLHFKLEKRIEAVIEVAGTVTCLCTYLKGKH